MSGRRVVSAALAAWLTALSSSSSAADAPKGSTANPWRVFAVLWRGETDVERGFREYFKQSGAALDMTVFDLDRRRDRLVEARSEIRRVEPDLIYTWGTTTALGIYGSSQQARDGEGDYIRDIPGVFTLVAYPRGSGLIDSFEGSGRNISGVRFLAPMEAQLSSLRNFRPISVLGAIYNAAESNSRLNIEELRSLAPSQGIRALARSVPLDSEGSPEASALRSTLESLKADGAEMIYIGPDSFLARNADVYTDALIDLELPSFAATEFPVLNSRAMMALVSRYFSLGRLTALQAEKILVEGRDPATLPAARLATFDLTFRADTLRALDRYPPLIQLLGANVIPADPDDSDETMR